MVVTKELLRRNFSISSTGKSISGIFFGLFILFGLLLQLAPVHSAKATHYVGSDLTITYGGSPGFYNIQLKFYRDCTGISMPSGATIQISAASCGLSFGQVSLQRISIADASEVCPGQTTTCSSPPNNSIPGRQVGTYIGSVQFTPAQLACADIRFAYSDIARNPGIVNINNGMTNQLGWFTEAILNVSNGIVNSSPVFSSSPVPYVCLNDIVSYNPQVYDPDGDSLVYSLVTPRTSATNFIPYTPNYSATQPFGIPGQGGFNFPTTLVPTTGQLTFKPTVLAPHVVVIRVEEFRKINGQIVRVGVVNRDVQVQVINCTTPPPTMPNMTVITNGVAGAPVPVSTIVEVDDCTPVCFQLPASTTAPPTVTLMMASNAANEIPGSTFSVSGQNTQNPVGMVCFTPNPQQAGQTFAFTVSVTDNGCPVVNDISLAIQFTIKKLSGFTATATEDTLCIGNSVQLSAVPVAGAVALNHPIYTSYAWSAFDLSGNPVNGGFQGNITNVVNVVATPVQTIRYVLTTTRGTGCVDTSSVVVHAVNNPPIANNFIGSNQVLCSSMQAALLTGSNPTGGNGTYTYLWELSFDNVVFTPAPGINNQNSYNPGVLTQTVWIRRRVTSSPCSHTSTAIQILVHPPLTGNTIASSQGICNGATPAALTGLAASGGSGNYTYLWLVSTISATSGFAPAPGINNQQNYNPPALTQVTWYRRVVIPVGCTGDTSASVQISVSPVVSANTIAAPQTICAGTAPQALTGSQPTGGNGTFTIQWQSSTAGPALGFSAIAGASGLGHAPGALAQTTWFRRVVTSGGCTVNSNAVEITVIPAIQNNQIEANQNVCAGNPAAVLTGQVPAGGNGTYSYLWEMSTISGTAGFAPAPGINNQAQYDPGVLTQTAWFRRVVISGNCTSVSATVKITVAGAISGNNISAAQTICAGTPAAVLAGTVPTGGSGVLSYWWIQSTSSPTLGYTAAAGVNTQQNYNPGMPVQTTWYRRIVLGSPCLNDTSLAIEITVIPSIVNNTISSDQHICSGEQPAPLTEVVPTNGYIFLWEASIAGPTSGFVAAPGINNQSSYSPPALSQTTWYRRKASASPCPDNYSNVIEIKVSPALVSPGIINSDTIVCINTTPGLLELYLPSGGSGNYTYFWESSTTGPNVGFGPAAGNYNQQVHQPGLIFQRTWFRCTVSSAPCASDTSLAVMIDVYPMPPAPTVTGDTICETGVAVLHAVPNGNTTLQWFGSVSGGQMIGTAGTITTPPLYTTTLYYVQALDVHGCVSQPRTAVTALVMPIPDIDAGPDVTITAGHYSILLATGAPSYSWSPPAGLSEITSPNTVAQPQVTTNYTVSCTTLDGCIASDEVLVTVLPPIQIPEVFSPNYDGFNDVWELGNQHLYPRLRIEIYNRWGNLLHKGEPGGPPWDGKFKGQDLPVATYYYVIYLSENAEPIAGSVTIMR